MPREGAAPPRAPHGGTRDGPASSLTEETGPSDAPIRPPCRAARGSGPSGYRISLAVSLYSSRSLSSRLSAILGGWPVIIPFTRLKSWSGFGRSFFE